MDKFAILTGVASLLGLALQIRDVFPEHRELRKSLVLIIVGVFVGSFLYGILGMKLEVERSLSVPGLAVAALVIVTAFLAMLAGFTNEPKKREDLFAASAVAGIAVFVCLVIYGVLRDKEPSPCDWSTAFYDDELLSLSEINASSGNYDRAMIILKSMMKGAPENDPRWSFVRKRTDELRAKQFAKH